MAEDVDEEAGGRLGGCMPFPAQTQNPVFVLLWNFSMGPYFPAPRAGAATRVLAHDDTCSVLPELSISPEPLPTLSSSCSQRPLRPVLSEVALFFSWGQVAPSVAKCTPMVSVRPNTHGPEPRHRNSGADSQLLFP